MKIDFIHARQILDSRGNPTVEVEVGYNGIITSAIAPSGASTGKYEAFELRDNNLSLYQGKSVLKAVENVNNKISKVIKNINFEDQGAIDHSMIELDGTENKSSLGANSILSTSLAIAKLNAKVHKKPFYQYINEFLGIKEISPKMPTPFVNILNGGVHADNPLSIQEFMIVPIITSIFHEKIRICCEIFYKLKELLKKTGYNTNVGDEGGFAPSIKKTEDAIECILEAISLAGYKINKDVAIALDVAASSFKEDNVDRYNLDGNSITSNELINFLENLVKKYNIISMEDPLGEEDYQGWNNLTKKIGKSIQLIGDDLFVTNKKLLAQGINNNYANSILIKPNQIGTLSETLDTIKFAYQNGYKYMISHRSGESEDTTISHIAVGTGAGQIKTGSVCRGERTAKYNELIRIEETLIKC